MSMELTSKKSAALILFASLGLAGCPSDGPLEEAGETLDEAADDVGDAIDDAADEVEDAVDGNG